MSETEIVVNSDNSSGNEVSETNETNNNTVQQPVENKPDPKQERLASRFAEINKRNSELTRKTRELRENESKVSKQLEDIKRYNEEMEMLKQNPFAFALNKAGMDFDTASKFFLDNPQLIKQKSKEELLEEKILAFENKFKEKEIAELEAEKAKVESEVNTKLSGYLTDLTKYVAQELVTPQHEYINAYGTDAANLFQKVTKQYIEETGDEPSDGELKRIVESIEYHLSEKVSKHASFYERKFGYKKPESIQSSNNSNGGPESQKSYKELLDEVRSETQSNRAPRKHLSNSDASVSTVVSNNKPKDFNSAYEDRVAKMEEWFKSQKK